MVTAPDPVIGGGFTATTLSAMIAAIAPAVWAFRTCCTKVQPGSELRSMSAILPVNVFVIVWHASFGGAVPSMARSSVAFTLAVSGPKFARRETKEAFDGLIVTLF